MIKAKLFKTMVVFAVLNVAMLTWADTLRIAYDADPVTADPYRSSLTPSGSLNSHIYEGLVARNNDLLLGTKFTWVTPTRLLVNLRQGVKFHNGADFTARDVIYSTCRMMHKVKGKNNVITGSLSPVTNVEAIGKYQVAFDTVKPYPLLFQKLKYMYMFTASLGTNVPETIKYDAKGDCGIGAYPTTAEVEQGYTKAGVGTGPFKLVSFTKGGKIKLVRNDNYWGKKTDWEKLEISAVTNTGARIAGLLSGDYDVVVSPSLEDMENLKNKKGFNVATTPGWRTLFILMDVGSDKAAGVTAPDGKNPLKDLRVRQAMSLAIDRQTIVDRLLKGNATVAKQFGAEYMKGAETGLPPLEYNPKKAKKLLAEAGYKDGFSFEFYLPSDRYPNGNRLAQVVAQYWSRIGLKVNLKPLPWSVFSKIRAAKKLGVWFYGWGHPQGFTQMIIYNFPTYNKDLNLGQHNKFTNFSSARVDKWMQKWAVEIDEVKADTYGVEAMKTVMAEMPGIPILYTHLSWAYRDGLNFKTRPDGFTNAKSITKSNP